MMAYTKKKITIPTLITALRIILVPFIIRAMVAQQWSVAFWFFLIAALTDALDGNLARFLAEQSLVGACLDPVADKLLLLSSFFTLAFLASPLIAVPAWFFWLILCRELILIAGAVSLFAIGGQHHIRPTWLGKGTTVIQMLFILWLFACSFFNWVPLKTFYALLLIMAGLLIGSLVQYGLVVSSLFLKYLISAEDRV